MKLRRRPLITGATLVLLSAVVIVFSFTTIGKESEENAVVVDSLQFPAGYPSPSFSAIEQLRRYPSPRYSDSNKLARLFNWVDPLFLGGSTQPGITRQQAVNNSVELQEELALNWNYSIVIPNSRMMANIPLNDPLNANMAYIRLANKYPQVPLGVITFWMQVRPLDAGFKYKKPVIISPDLNERFYLHYTHKGKPRKAVCFSLPDSLVAVDGNTQKFYLSNILAKLTRPISMINENGEEPPGAEMDDIIRNDVRMKRLKDSLGYTDWTVFMAEQKLGMRKKYVSCFLEGLPGLKDTRLSWYAIEGGPIDRFDWTIMRKIGTPMNGNFYSTPDFYPRWPRNWKDWQGPWHGWRWIAEGRLREIAAGDKLFSPFICAGWSADPEDDVRPAQWLGLLKCLSAAGAEFFYTGYFNLKKPFNDPRQYVWQMAMASYAQAVTSRFEGELRNGNLLKNSSGKTITSINTGDKNVLLVVRKLDGKKRYVISGALQPYSNAKGEVPDKKVITAEFEGHQLTFEVRRQGSVYIFDAEDPSAPVFYQLDAWHGKDHPDHWSKDFYFEAEVSDGNVPPSALTEKNSPGTGDFSKFTSYILLTKSNKVRYNFTVRDSALVKQTIMLRCKAATPGTITCMLNGRDAGSVKIKAGNWGWVQLELEVADLLRGKNQLVLACGDQDIRLDKVVITAHPGSVRKKYE